MKDDEWNAIIDTNLSSVFRTSKAVLRGMMKARQGRIISIASVVGLTGNPGQSNYAAARSEEHTSELQSLMRISYAVFCLKKKKTTRMTHSSCTHNTLTLK